jgi:hypothetical protein
MADQAVGHAKGIAEIGYPLHKKEGRFFPLRGVLYPQRTGRKIFKIQAPEQGVFGIFGNIGVNGKVVFSVVRAAAGRDKGGAFGKDDYNIRGKGWAFFKIFAEGKVIAKGLWVRGHGDEDNKDGDGMLGRGRLPAEPDKQAPFGNFGVTGKEGALLKNKSPGKKAFPEPPDS